MNSEQPPAATGHAPGRRESAVDVLVVGAGPAGLALASRLAATGSVGVEVVDREDEPGGVPRHCFHSGFGPRGPGRPVTGPAYARHWADAAVHAGATLRTGVTVTGWSDTEGPATGPLTVDVTSPAGLERITARAVVLATGARERARAARLVPGTRPAGVFTTGELQRTVRVRHRPVGLRAVVVGAESVSYSAVRTLREAGVEVVAMVTELPYHQAAPATALDTRLRHGVPLLVGARVGELLGRGRLSGVALRHRDGRSTSVACDTVVFTGDWIPDHELARRGGVTLDRATLGPAVDGSFRTDRAGVFAVGNLLHAVEPAGTAAREGLLAAGPVLRHLTDGARPAVRVPVEVEAPLLWIAPNRVDPADPRVATGGFTLRTESRLGPWSALVVSRGGEVLHRQRLLRSAVPNRTVRLSAAWTAKAWDGADGEPVRISVER
ncbi:dihydropyrimidine dehydrogenase subunit A [Streptomyces sp. S4.7]|uniref:NAD(P)/FAD-dependent oxidoreductase n=1 Tax=Streptomyces sp. S4.7 TaxID=2705439 RepID=UPI00139831E6|nr:FAD-dependent oxidoreductase [Streptomyces sp. S4.7]QHY93965.1 dihydropyrimidine dehydrogenase subunit A [Streptomyces sp. S4.7]